MSLAFVFPGQGAQTVGLLTGFAQSAAVSGLLAEADRALGESLSGLIANGPAESLALTVNTQPAMLVAGLACYLAWREAGGPEPVAVAGHSLGEYTALTAAGSFKVEDAVRLVRLRAQPPSPMHFLKQGCRAKARCSTLTIPRRLKPYWIASRRCMAPLPSWSTTPGSLAMAWLCG